ncbi:hypothetical protein CDN99_01045 [Roseateles aquatilis]|uniref:histidine kinase n=1 Tax=Roseateles aquatilis TaxID=431061 RepID=A0A246JKI2_9BURK|nr:ATP-binding protein [Roseateles aquatilis]OWQ93121.1 hypothetical protein CDN99_01045 [Roseateles aquatilis]
MQKNLGTLYRELVAGPMGQSARATSMGLKALERAHPRLSAQIAILLALAVCSLVAQVLSEHIDPGSLMMVYLVGATAVAIRSGLTAAVIFVVLSVVLYDLLFLKPHWHFSRLEAHHYLTFGLMLAVGCLISSLASSLRKKTLEIADKARRTQARNALATDLAQATSPRDVQQSIRHAVLNAMGHASSMLLSVKLQVAKPLSTGDGDTERALGRDDEPASVDELRIPLVGASAQVGVLVVKNGWSLNHRAGDLKLIHAFADQAAIALERLHLEQINSQAKVEAETERLRSTLLAAISHDFRSPITAIVGSVSALLEQGADISEERHRALLRGVLSEARRVHHLMSNLLDLTRIEGGGVQPKFEWCPVDELVSAVLSPLQAKLNAFRVVTRFDPDDLLWCDPRLLEQLFGNLLGNACRYAPEGSLIEVAIAIESGEAHLTIRDNGPGFPPGREQEMVKKFSRGASLTGQGTGLGLAICDAIAKLHGGRLLVSNREGACVQWSIPQPTQSASAMEALE